MVFLCLDKSLPIEAHEFQTLVINDLLLQQFRPSSNDCKNCSERFGGSKKFKIFFLKKNFFFKKKKKKKIRLYCILTQILNN